MGEFHITGHSLGAILSVFAARDLLEHVLEPMGRTISSIYTFGEPRGGDSNFADFAAAKLANMGHYRVVHYTDPVPHLPAQKVGFKHSPQEIFYNTADSTGPYQVCAKDNGEDPNCSDKLKIEGLLLGLLTDMRLEYVGFSILKDYAACKF